MTILYVITNILQLVILLALMAVLFSTGVVLQMMEVSIVYLIIPVFGFMLRQSCRTVALSLRLTAGYTFYLFKKMCGIDVKLRSPMDQISLETPEVPYSRSAITGLVVETQPLAYDILTAQTAASSVKLEEEASPSIDQISEQPTVEEEEEAVVADTA